jgi:hypothetical protein
VGTDSACICLISSASRMRRIIQSKSTDRPVSWKVCYIFWDRSGGRGIWLRLQGLLSRLANKRLVSFSAFFFCKHSCRVAGNESSCGVAYDPFWWACDCFVLNMVLLHLYCGTQKAVGVSVSSSCAVAIGIGLAWRRGWQHSSF